MSNPQTHDRNADQVAYWNGPAGHPLGTGDACADANPTCNEAQIRADNAINTVEPTMRDPDAGDFTLVDPGALPSPVAVPAFVWDATPLAVPADAEIDIDTRASVGAS